MPKCKAKTQKGNRCKNQAKRGGLCGVHSRPSKSNILHKKEKATAKPNIIGLKGWGERGPKRGTERDVLVKHCGNGCFLVPTEKKFPVCKKCVGDSCSCEPDCGGILAARIRSKIWGYTDVRRRADALYTKYCKKK